MIENQSDNVDNKENDVSPQDNTPGDEKSSGDQIAENDELGLEDAATNIGEQVQDFRESEAGKELEERFRGFIQGFGGSS